MQPSEPSRTPRILVVDDDASIRDLICLALEEEGHEVHAAAEGESALAMLTDVQPDIILLDTRMPIMDGWEFARRYHEMETRGGSLIVMTAIEDPANTATELGADAYLAKPFDLVDLIDVVERFT